MKYATLENNKVKNIIVLPDDFDGSEFGGKPLVPANNAAIGDGWDGNQFIKQPPIEPPEPTPEEKAEALRKEKQYAYQKESDPLFFKWQRGEATEQEWLDKVGEIKARYQ